VIECVSGLWCQGKGRWERAYEEVLGVELLVLGHVEVFLGHEHTLTEEGLVDELAVSFGDQPVWCQCVVCTECGEYIAYILSVLFWILGWWWKSLLVANVQGEVEVRW
jgi:hypothetical protein